ncbi:hypothetical protein MCEMSEM23_01909 [Rhabdaerophilaceae bacterium]
MRRSASVLFAAFVLVGCQSTGPAQQVSATPPQPQGVSITPPGFRLPTGAGCSADIARFRAIMKNDIETGHTTKRVYDEIEAEMQKADSFCSTGNSAAASGHVRATRARYGYPAG